MHHDLKIWTPYFDLVYRGEKPFEIRLDDRGYAVGDTLVLNEWDQHSGQATGRTTKKVVTYILRGGQFGLQDGYVAMAIK